MEKFITHNLSDNCVCQTSTIRCRNLAYQVDSFEDVRANRKEFYQSINIDRERFTFVHQTHSDVILKVTESLLGKGLRYFEEGPLCDALYTKMTKAPLCIFHADCVPIFFINEKESLVGIIHAGYKGTLKHITYKAISNVLAKENLDIKDFKFFIGPYRHKESFPIKEDTKQEIIDAGLSEAIIDECFDNGLANVLDLKKLGAVDEQISDCNIDTFTDERCFSAYKKTPIGRMVSFIYLK